MQLCYYPAAPLFHIMALLSRTRVVRVIFVWVDASYSEVACVCVGVAAEIVRLRLTALGSASTKRTVFLIMPKGRDCAKSASESSNDLNMR